MIKPRSDEFWEYEGHELKIMHINWGNDHLDQAFQCNWYRTPTSCEITYGKSPDDAFEKMKKQISIHSWNSTS